MAPNIGHVSEAKTSAGIVWRLTYRDLDGRKQQQSLPAGHTRAHAERLLQDHEARITASLVDHTKKAIRRVDDEKLVTMLELVLSELSSRIGSHAYGTDPPVAEEFLRRVRLLCERHWSRGKSQLLAIRRFGALPRGDGTIHFAPDAIEKLELSVRPYNCLIRAGIESIGELTMMTEAELLAMPMLGTTSLAEISGVLAERGLELRRE